MKRQIFQFGICFICVLMGHQEDLVGSYKGVVLNLSIIGIKVETVIMGSGGRLENTNI